ncbi:MAG TPA: TonB-dependent receptor plug domain-containing protein [Lacunisphaera sp.]|jgi:outer membrane receptor protein involved in Fe transport
MNLQKIQATKLSSKTRCLTLVAAFSLLLNSGLAQAAAPTSAAAAAATPAPSDVTNSKAKSSSDEIVELSPFEVNTSKDVGYHATNTLAGSRISTDLRDLAGPISVVTKQFLDDTGAVGVNDILTYMVGAEGTRDIQANTPQLGRTADNGSSDPSASTRGRALAPFDVTRNFFYSLTEQPLTTLSSGTSVGFDAYNLDGVTISRGPNSILAGLGSPAGIINYSPQQALLGKTSTELTYRFGSFNDQRATVNTNYGDKDGNFAIRVAGEASDKGFKQQPAWAKDRRWYIAGTYKPFKKTTLHASYENVKVNQALPNSFTPEDDISPWIAAGKPSSPSPTVGATGLVGATNAGPNVIFNSDGSFYKAYDNTNSFTYFNAQPANVGLWSAPRFNSNKYGNWDDLNTSGSTTINKLRTLDLSLDQEILPSLNLNVAYVDEKLDSNQLNLGRPDFVVDLVDVNQQTPWGAVNPHYGETYMYFSGLDNKQTTASTNRVGRATLTYDLDLTKYNKWLGHYRFTGFLEKRKTEQDFNDYNVAAAGGSAAVGGGPGIITYTGGTAANGYFMTTTPQRPTLANGLPYTNSATGLTAGTLSEVDQLKEEDKHLVKLASSAFVVQGYLVDDLVVPMFGVRRDSDDSAFSTGSAQAAPAYPVLSNVTATTRTYGLVVHGPDAGFANLKWLSLFYSKSENFIPNAGSVDLLGNASPNPKGLSQEYGISFDLFEHKLNAKISSYKTTAKDGPAPSVNFPLVQWSIPFVMLKDNNANGAGAIADIAAQAGVTNYNSGIAPGITTGAGALANAYSQDNVARGIELELTYNVSKNWRVYGTLTKEESVASNIAPALTKFINDRVAYWKSIGIWDSPLTSTHDWSGAPETVQQVYNNDILPGFIQYQAADGQPAQQLHRWKASVVTNYTFTDGPVKGFSVGTGLRYLDKTVIGNPAIYNSAGSVVGLDLAHPYTTPSQINADAWVGYSMKWRSYHLTFQLRGVDLQSSGSYRAVNANSDGTHQLYSIIQPRTFFFTTKVDF